MNKYLQLIKSQYWQQVRQRIIKRDKVCKLCACKHNMQVHHLTYFAPDGTSVLFKEKHFLNRLILLCDNCHSKVHKNKKHKFNPHNYGRTESKKIASLRQNRTTQTTWGCWLRYIRSVIFD